MNAQKTAQRVLLIGGFGFVGSQLIKLLHGYDIVVYDNLLSGDKLNTAPFIHGDILDKKHLEDIIPNFDIIVHLAGIVGEPACSIDPITSLQINVKGTENIISALDKYQKLIYISSTSVYGDTSSKYVTEESPIRPANNYALHKALSEDIVKQRDGDYIILRPVTSFGISDRLRLDLIINTLIFEALTTGIIDVYEPEIIRPSIHVKDFARVIKFAIENHMAWNEVYNIGDPSLVRTKLDIATEIAAFCNASINVKEGSSLDKRDYFVYYEKLLESGFVFPGDMLIYAIRQFEQMLIRTKINPEKFMTVELFKQYLLKEGSNVSYKNNM